MKPLYVKKNGTVNKISGIGIPVSYPAENVAYDNTESGLTADNIQDAVDEIKDNLGTAASKDIPASGNASSTQVVMGNDTRLTDARPASDVSDWAKASTKPSYNYSEIGNTPTLGTASAKDYTTSVTSDSTDLVTSGAVKSAIDSAVSSVYKPSGDKTCAELVSTLLIGSNLGNVYNTTDSGTTTSDFREGAGHPIPAGSNVVVVDVGNSTYKFDLLTGFIDLSNYIQKSQTSGLVKNDGSIDTNTYSTTDEKVKQSPSTTNSSFEILFSGTADNTEHTEGAQKSNKLKFNPSYGSIMEGDNTSAIGSNSHAEGKTTKAISSSTHAEGESTTAWGPYGSHAEGFSTYAAGSYSHSEGGYTSALNAAAHAEGYQTNASGNYGSHAEGNATTASGADSHAEGNKSKASGGSSHAEGLKTTASGADSHAEGSETLADSFYSHAEGYKTTALGNSAHAEGFVTRSEGEAAHAEGYYTTASGDYSHASGNSTSAGGTSQTVIGQYNTPDSTSLFIVGNGTANNARSNALTVDVNAKTTLETVKVNKSVSKFITGTGTAGSVSGSTYYPSKWVFNIGLTPVEGDEVTIKVPVAGYTKGVWMTTDNETTYHPIAYNTSSRFTTNFGVNAIITLVYCPSLTVGVYALNGSTGSSTVTGVWLVKNCYDSDTNDNYYDRNKYTGTIKCGTTAIVKSNIIVGKDGVYTNLKDAASFDITYPILYANSAIAASATGTDNYDIINFTITTTQSMTLTAYKPVYIQGTLANTTFKPSSTKLTQTPPSDVGSTIYMLLGIATSTTQVYLTERHPMYKYPDGSNTMIEITASGGIVYQQSSNTPNWRKVILGEWSGSEDAAGANAGARVLYVDSVQVQPSTGTFKANKTKTKAIVALTGSGTAGSDKGEGVSPRYIPSLWTFNAGLTVANGEVYFIKIPVAGGTYGVWLSLNNGTNYYPVAISTDTGRFTTHYPANTVIAITYESASKCNCYPKAGGDSRSDVTGTFRVLNDYDANTTYNFSGTTFVSGDKDTGSHDANAITANGNYYYRSNGPTTAMGASTADGALYVASYSASWVGQIAQDYRNGNIFVRGKNNGTWQAWKKPDAGSVNGYTVEKSVPSTAVFTDTTYSAMSSSELTTGTATSSRVVRADYLKTGINSLIDTKIQALDVTGGTNTAGKTVDAWSETDGKISFTFKDISITKSQVSDFSHTHGNIQNGGTLQTNDITIASGDKLVVTDSSDSAKVARASISFDGSTATKALTQKGTWESFTNNAGTVTKVSTGVGLTGGDITDTGTIKAKLKQETASTLDSASVTATASRQYAVHPDKSGYLSVNVPWVNDDTKNTAGSTDTSSKIFLIGATSQAANPQTYSDDQVYTTSGVLTAATHQATNLVVTATNGTSGGISLYSSSSSMDDYGIYFRKISDKGAHGYVTSSWATYFTMSNSDNRGWVFRRNSSGNVASIDTSGNAVFNGSVTVGGNAANTSGARMVYDSTNSCINFVFT